MNQRWKRSLVSVVAIAVGGATLAACSDSHNVMDTEGEGARRIATVGWVMFAMAGAVGIVFLGALAYALLRRRPEAHEERRPHRFSERTYIVAGGVVLPSVVIGVLTFATLGVLAEPGADDPLRIEVVGHQFWWEVTYLDEEFTTANELHIPVDRPVEITLRSDDVIHSFWVPDLAPKLDMVPGHENRLTIEADTAGTYRGQCAEYCGIQHAYMIFFVIADEPDDYQRWLDQERQPAPEPATSQLRAGEEAFNRLPCGSCHTIRGTEADGELGPDLTHFASRRTIGAGAVENTLGNLYGWIPNSQTIKPGNLMPPIPLSPEELDDVVAYLRSLE